MENKDLILDTTNVNIDVKLEKNERIEKFTKDIDNVKYTEKIKVNNTIIYLNFLSKDKLNSKTILKVLG